MVIVLGPDWLKVLLCPKITLVTGSGKGQRTATHQTSHPDHFNPNVIQAKLINKIQ